MHQAEQQSADQNGVDPAERQTVGENGAAEQEFLADGRNQTHYNELQHNLVALGRAAALPDDLGRKAGVIKNADQSRIEIGLRPDQHNSPEHNREQQRREPELGFHGQIPVSRPPDAPAEHRHRQHKGEQIAHGVKQLVADVRSNRGKRQQPQQHSGAALGQPREVEQQQENQQRKAGRNHNPAVICFVGGIRHPEPPPLLCSFHLDPLQMIYFNIVPQKTDFVKRFFKNRGDNSVLVNSVFPQNSDSRQKPLHSKKHESFSESGAEDFMPKKNALPNARDQMWPLSKMPAEQDGFGRSSPAPLWPPATPTVHRTVIPCRLCTGFSNVNEKRTPERVPSIKQVLPTDRESSS